MFTDSDPVMVEWLADVLRQEWLAMDRRHRLLLQTLSPHPSLALILHLAAYSYPGNETGEEWTYEVSLGTYQGINKAFIRPYQGLSKDLAVHPWAQEFLYAAMCLLLVD